MFAGVEVLDWEAATSRKSLSTLVATYRRKYGPRLGRWRDVCQKGAE